MKPVTAAMLAFFVTAGVLLADGINWFDGFPGPSIQDSSGSDVPFSSQWVIQMYVSTDTTINFVNGAPTADDTLLAGVSTQLNDFGSGGAGSDGYFFHEFSPSGSGGPADNANVYSVIFNATNIAEATEYAVIDNVTTNVHNSTGLNPNWDYDTGGTVAGDWHPIVVPEPVSLALMGLGICAAGVRKKFQAKA